MRGGSGSGSSSTMPWATINISSRLPEMGRVFDKVGQGDLHPPDHRKMKWKAHREHTEHSHHARAHEQGCVRIYFTLSHEASMENELSFPKGGCWGGGQKGKSLPAWGSMLLSEALFSLAGFIEQPPPPPPPNSSVSFLFTSSWFMGEKNGKAWKNF